jgi:hypothetical protein
MTQAELQGALSFLQEETHARAKLNAQQTTLTRDLHRLLDKVAELPAITPELRKDLAALSTKANAAIPVGARGGADDYVHCLLDFAAKVLAK